MELISSARSGRTSREFTASATPLNRTNDVCSVLTFLLVLLMQLSLRRHEERASEDQLDGECADMAFYSLSVFRELKQIMSILGVSSTKDFHRNLADIRIICLGGAG